MHSGSQSGAWRRKLREGVRFQQGRHCARQFLPVEENAAPDDRRRKQRVCMAGGKGSGFEGGSEAKGFRACEQIVLHKCVL